MSDQGDRADLRDDFIRRGLRFSQLRLLVALKETGQVSAAAAQLAITQPAASRLMAELERLSEARLYDRHPRGVILTEAGERLARRARAVLSQLDDAHVEMRDLARGAGGEVRIGAVTGPALELVLPAIRELRVTFPEIQISVLVDTSDKLAEGLAVRSLDFYIGRLHENIDSRLVELRPVGPEPVALIVRRGHPLTRVQPLALADCLAHDWVMQPPGGLQRRTVEQYLLEHGLPLPQRILGTASLLLTLALISETNAVAPMARAVARFFGESRSLGGNIEILDVPAEMAVAPYSLIRRRDQDLSAAAERVFALISHKIRSLEAGAGDA
ncbi:LysR family transcriptional regulator [Poseidonocella sp. HB161398]|uniref:LysR family transcriptional regulator n=1 Tax=Poseidonocella sp. HB161398 TaxID=2320855 RepID=UPI00197CFA2D|nr:LysR family transcriptional regulator [Poseidonocella sp. HB161398]